MAFSFELKLAISSELYGAISAGPEQNEKGRRIGVSLKPPIRRRNICIGFLKKIAPFLLSKRALIVGLALIPSKPLFESPQLVENP